VRTTGLIKSDDADAVVIVVLDEAADLLLLLFDNGSFPVLFRSFLVNLCTAFCFLTRLCRWDRSTTRSSPSSPPPSSPSFVLSLLPVISFRSDLYRRFFMEEHCIASAAPPSSFPCSTSSDKIESSPEDEPPLNIGMIPQYIKYRYTCTINEDVD